MDREKQMDRQMDLDKRQVDRNTDKETKIDREIQDAEKWDFIHRQKNG